MDEVLDELNRSRVELNAQDVIANFNSLRSRHEPGEKVRRLEWNELRDLLYSGFTGNQLLGYMKHLQGQGSETASEESVEKMAGGSEWKPGTSVFLELKGKRRATTAASNTAFRNIQGKMMLVETILRVFWKLSIQNEIGRLDMRIESAVFFTLLESKTRPLTNLIESCGDDIRMQIWQPADMVSVTGLEERCLEVREAVNELISGVQSTEIDVPRGSPVFGVGDQQLEDNFTDMLRRQYDVFCKRKDGQKVTVYYTSDAAIENALRSIYLAVALPLDRTTELVTHVRRPLSASIYPFTAPQTLSWVDRKSQWVRWAMPLSKGGISGGQLAREPPKDIFDKHENPAIPKIMEHFFQQSGGGIVFREDKKYLREIITASVGRCLFKHRDSNKAGDEAKFSRFENARSHAFATDVPNAVTFLSGLDRIQRDDDKDSCRIRLVPSPRNTLLFPPVELELDICPQDQFLAANVVPTVTRASIVVDERNIDMLLPDTTVDLRFTKTVQYDLLESTDYRPGHESPIISKLQKCLTTFPARYPLLGPQPQMPAFCSLLIPRRFALGRGKAGSTKAGQAETLEAEYMVPPVGHLTASRIAKFNYQGLSLDFTNPSTGPVLPQRTAHMSLTLGRYDDEIRPRDAYSNSRLSSMRDDDDTVGLRPLRVAFRSLFSRACRLAFEIGASYPDTNTSATGLSNSHDSSVNNKDHS